MTNERREKILNSFTVGEILDNELLVLSIQDALEEADK
jgi:hypothetical protein